MYNHCLRIHTPEDKKNNFAKPTAEQNPYFGIEPAFEDLLRIWNRVRYPSWCMSLDEELVYLRGRASIIQYIQAKRNRFGPKLFMLSGGKARERPTSFAAYGKGYEMVMSSILGMKLRWKGYWIVVDSWFNGIPLLVHTKL